MNLFSDRSSQRTQSGGTATLSDDAPALPLGAPAPDAGFLAVHQGMLETRHAHRAALAHSLRLHRVVLVVGVEDRGIQTTTCPQLAPLDLRHRQCGSPN